MESSNIPGSHLVAQVFGYWPSFHDAEILWLRIDRTDPNKGIGPTIELVLHCFEMTNEVSSNGYYVLRNHMLVHFRFHRAENVNLQGFNQQNAISSLSIEPSPDRTSQAKYDVEINPAFGLGGSFICQEAVVLSVQPCDEEGNPISA